MLYMLVETKFLKGPSLNPAPASPSSPSSSLLHPPPQPRRRWRILLLISPIIGIRISPQPLIINTRWWIQPPRPIPLRHRLILIPQRRCQLFDVELRQHHLRNHDVELLATEGGGDVERAGISAERDDAVHAVGDALERWVGGRGGDHEVCGVRAGGGVAGGALDAEVGVGEDGGGGVGPEGGVVEDGLRGVEDAAVGGLVEELDGRVRVVAFADLVAQVEAGVGFVVVVDSEGEGADGGGVEFADNFKVGVEVAIVSGREAKGVPRPGVSGTFLPRGVCATYSSAPRLPLGACIGPYVGRPPTTTVRTPAS